MVPLLGTRGLHWWLSSTQHTQWNHPKGNTARPGRFMNTGLARGVPGLRSWSPFDHAAQVPAVFLRVRGCASDSVHRPSGGCFSCLAETVPQCILCRRLEIPWCSSGKDADMPVCAQRQGVQTAQKTVLVSQPQFIDVGSIRCELAATSSSSFQREGLSRVFVLFLEHFRTPSIWSADFFGAQGERGTPGV